MVKPHPIQQPDTSSTTAEHWSDMGQILATPLLLLRRRCTRHLACSPRAPVASRPAARFAVFNAAAGHGRLPSPARPVTLVTRLAVTPPAAPGAPQPAHAPAWSTSTQGRLRPRACTYPHCPEPATSWSLLRSTPPADLVVTAASPRRQGRRCQPPQLPAAAFRGWPPPLPALPHPRRVCPECPAASATAAECSSARAGCGPVLARLAAGLGRPPPAPTTPSRLALPPAPPRAWLLSRRVRQPHTQAAPCAGCVPRPAETSGPPRPPANSVRPVAAFATPARPTVLPPGPRP
ncbi:hypothetical protein VPH35_029522 [Triticum aestivum]